MIGGYFGDSISVRHIDNFDSLPIDIKKQLEPGLGDVAAQAFNRPLDSNFSADVNHHIRSGPLRMAFQNGEPVAFVAAQVFPELNAIYLAGMVKKPTAPSGLVETIVKDFVQTSNPSILITRTQNDRVMEIMNHLCDCTVPLDRPANQSDLNILNQLCLLKQDIDLNNLIIHGCYGNQMIHNLPQRRINNPKITAFSDSLDYRSGDAVLLIGYRNRK